MTDTPNHPTSFEWIEAHQYVSLTTFKRSGERVATPVWFATAGGKIYLYSELNAGKMKRIRNNPRVEVAPCTFRGAVIGPTVGGSAVELGADQARFVHDLLNRRYTWKKHVFEFVASIPKKLKLQSERPDGFLEITLN